jgi:hypothetical protein
MLLFLWVITPCGLVSRSRRLKMDCFFKTLSSAYKSARCHNPGEQHPLPHSRENLKSLSFHLQAVGLAVCDSSLF